MRFSYFFSSILHNRKILCSNDVNVIEYGQDTLCPSESVFATNFSLMSSIYVKIKWICDSRVFDLAIKFVLSFNTLKA